MAPPELQPRMRRRFVVTTTAVTMVPSSRTWPPDWFATGPDLLGVADITYIRCRLASPRSR